jgi:hypothetical protein
MGGTLTEIKRRCKEVKEKTEERFRKNRRKPKRRRKKDLNKTEVR